MAGDRGSARQAREAAFQSDLLRRQFEDQARLQREQSARETKRAQRLLMRSIRAGSGGIFETDPQTLGAGGVLG